MADEGSIKGILGGREARKSGCAVCGKPMVANVGVTLELRGMAYRDLGLSASDGHSKRFSRGFCEQHAVIAWDAGVRALGEPFKGGDE